MDGYARTNLSGCIISVTLCVEIFLFVSGILIFFSLRRFDFEHGPNAFVVQKWTLYSKQCRGSFFSCNAIFFLSCSNLLVFSDKTTVFRLKIHDFFLWVQNVRFFKKHKKISKVKNS